MEKVMKSSLEIDSSKPSAFISYSWDGEDHIKRVGKLVAALERAGIQTIWDKKDFILGDPLQYMVTQAIEKCEYVLLVCTPRYKEKTDMMFGGAGFEESIISGDVFNNQNHRKYIPLIFNGTIKESMPNWTKGKLGVLMTNEDEFIEGIQKLIDTINPKPSVPKSRRPRRPSGFYALSEPLQCAVLNNIEVVLGSVDLFDYHGCLEEMEVLLEHIKMSRVSDKVKKLINEKKEVVNRLILEDIEDLENDR